MRYKPNACQGVMKAGDLEGLHFHINDAGSWCRVVLLRVGGSKFQLFGFTGSVMDKNRYSDNIFCLERIQAITWQDIANHFDFEVDTEH